MLTETNLGRWHLNIITSSLSLSLWELFIFITNIFTVTFPQGKLPQDFPVLGYQQQPRLHPVGRASMNEPSSHEETNLDHQPTHQMCHKSVSQLPSYPGWAHSFRLNGIIHQWLPYHPKADNRPKTFFILWLWTFSFTGGEKGLWT